MTLAHKRARFVPYPPAPEVTELLDQDFDECDELVLFEPPILATRKGGGKLTRLDDDTGSDD